MAQKTVTVGTSGAKASLDTNFGNIQDNFTELYGGEYKIEPLPISWWSGGTTPPGTLDQISRPPVRFMKFDPTTQQDVKCRWFVPDDIVAASGVQFRVTYVITNATGPSNEGVAFELAGSSMGDGDATNAAVGSYVAVTQTGITAAQWVQKITGWSAAVTVANLAAGERVQLAFRRAPANAADTYMQNVGVECVEIRFVRTPQRPTA